jgi:phosphatidylglycerol---prolipoprotein diacylglyceryl transferase
MFVNNIDPDILHIGPFSIRFYGIVYALGFLTVTYLLSRAAKEGRIKNLTKDKAENIAVLGILGGIIGARIFHVLTDFHLYKDDILGIFAVWNGGLGYFGGIAGGALAIYWYARRHKISFLEIFDHVSIPLAFITAFGRIANYTNSEIFGPPSGLPWCVVFQRIDDVCRHPAQLYHAAMLFMIGFALIGLSRTRMSKRAGFITAAFIFMYGVSRFIDDIFRIDFSFLIFGLSITQILSIVACMISGYFLLMIIRRKR